MYLGGSVANECFDLESSDIDCYIVTATDLSQQEISEIEIMHKQFCRTPC